MTDMENFKIWFVKKRDHFDFREYRKSAVIRTTIFASRKNCCSKIVVGIRNTIFAEKTDSRYCKTILRSETNPKVTIVQIQWLMC